MPLLVANKAGGSGLVGTTAVAQQKGDTHVLLTFIPGQAQAALVAGKGAATFRELTLICNLALDEQLIVVKADSPFKTIRDIIAEAKKRPGELTIGGTGAGQDVQICQRLFERSAGIKFRYVPFKSGGECITALLGGHVNMIWANPPEFVPQWEAKMVRPVAVAKSTRMADFPDVPTLKEIGHDVTYFFYRGIRIIGGVVVIIFGLFIAGILKLDFLMVQKKIYLSGKPAGYVGTFVVGMTFAAGWSPCIGSILGTILVYAGSKGSALYGFQLLAAYSLGLAVPFFLSALAINVFLSYSPKLAKFMRAIMLISGLLRIIFGILLLTDQIRVLTRLLPDFGIKF